MAMPYVMISSWINTMKTRVERAYVEASIIGDSHAMAVWKHLAPAIVFRHTMTAPAKHFDGRFFKVENDRLHISAVDIEKTFPRADQSVVEVMRKARERLDSQLQAILDAKLPVVSSLGAASYRFARRVAATDPSNERNISNKIIRTAANDYVDNFVLFHKALLDHVPSITFMLGACRYPDNQKITWLAYDQIIIDRMAELGISTIDVRRDTGDSDLKVLPEFAASDVLHGNERWCQTVADEVFARVAEPAIPISSQF